MDAKTDEWMSMDGQTGRWADVDGRVDGQRNGRTDGRMRVIIFGGRIRMGG